MIETFDTFLVDQAAILQVDSLAALRIVDIL